VYVRVGSTNRRADPELIGELRRVARGEGYDEQPMPGLDSEALDFRAASESFATVRKLARRDLETLRLLTEHQGRKVPTVGGMILFGKDRERHFPDAWIQAGRFQGVNKSHIVDRTEIHSIPARAVGEIAAAIGLTPRATRTRLARLVGNGHVREIGTGPQDPRRRYYLAERGPV